MKCVYHTFRGPELPSKILKLSELSNIEYDMAAKGIGDKIGTIGWTPTPK